MAVAVQIMSRPPEFPARQLARPGRPLRLFRGGLVEDPVIAYESWGTLNPSRDNARCCSRVCAVGARGIVGVDPAHGWWDDRLGARSTPLASSSSA
jgi:homoserine O-acetyltransferase